MMDSELALWSWAFLLIYTLVMLGCGIVGMRLVKSSDDFATARGAYGPLFLAFTMVASTASGATFLGIPGIAYQYGVSGLPEGVQEKYVYQYDAKFKFIKKHVIKSGHTHLGIQTATFANDRWWFGCYGKPQILFVADANFKMKGRYQFDCSLGITGLPGGRYLSASGQCRENRGCTGSARVVMPDDEDGFRWIQNAKHANEK